jgi:polyisoprenoid-binding protein YceI
MKKINLVLAVVFLAFSAFIMPSSGVKETYKVVTSESSVEWLAKKVTGQHNGSVGIKEGNLDIANKVLTGGYFVMDMTAIKVLDLEEGSNMNTKLLGHLKSDDFFGVETHPTATLKITSAQKTGKKAKADAASEYSIKADLTIKGNTHPISFVGYVLVESDKVSARATKIVFDRSKFDIRYGSPSFFNDLGDKAIYNDVEISVKLTAKK